MVHLEYEMSQPILAILLGKENVEGKSTLEIIHTTLLLELKCNNLWH